MINEDELKEKEQEEKMKNFDGFELNDSENEESENASREDDLYEEGHSADSDDEGDDFDDEPENPEDDMPMDAEIARKIVDDCCGKDSSGFPKAALTASSEMWAVNSNKARTVSVHSSHKPVVDIQKHFEFIQVDLSFKTGIDSDLKVLWNMYEKFGDALNAITEKSQEVPFLALTIVPVADEGQYYMLCVNPVFWVLQPKLPGQDCTIMRLLFHADDVSFYETDEIDMYEVEAGAQRAVKDRQEAAIKAAEKQAEEEEYRRKQNEMLEELRRNGQA